VIIGKEKMFWILGHGLNSSYISAMVCYNGKIGEQGPWPWNLVRNSKIFKDI
jgi:hypothetical protein